MSEHYLLTESHLPINLFNSLLIILFHLDPKKIESSIIIQRWVRHPQIKIMIGQVLLPPHLHPGKH